jgi:hypothetical protein
MRKRAVTIAAGCVKRSRFMEILVFSEESGADEHVV